jgi:hypothetical protein
LTNLLAVLDVRIETKAFTLLFLDCVVVFDLPITDIACSVAVPGVRVVHPHPSYISLTRLV